MLIDSHCHLDTFDDAEIPDVIARAREAGVERMVTIGIRAHQSAAVRSLTERFPEVWGTVGVHPQRVGEAPLPSVAELLALADHSRIVALLGALGGPGGAAVVRRPPLPQRTGAPGPGGIPAFGRDPAD